MGGGVSFCSLLGTQLWIMHSHPPLQTRSGDSAQQILYDDRVPQQRPELGCSFPAVPAADLLLTEPLSVCMPAFTRKSKMPSSTGARTHAVFLALGLQRPQNIDYSSISLIKCCEVFFLTGIFRQRLLFEMRPGAAGSRSATGSV